MPFLAKDTNRLSLMALGVKFPPVSMADDDGLLALGGELDEETLLLAYRSGIFPWPFDESTLAWFAPPKRCVLFFDEMHISKSLARSRRREVYTFSINKNFKDVIGACAKAKNRKGQRGTWITKDMVRAYTELNRHGYAQSVETWQESELVGGLYGVKIGGFFAGESMFHKETDASKLSLWYLVEVLKKEGLSWIDCQVMTPLLKSFGARLIPRDEYQVLLKEALSVKSRR